MEKENNSTQKTREFFDNIDNIRRYRKRFVS